MKITDIGAHGGGAGSLALCAVQQSGGWYERGLLQPFLNYDEPPEYLNSRPDPMAGDGFVHLSPRPGLGEDINFDYINTNLVSR
jgi:L-alanine-DL-glutamate epimerase-like enolase superfamily enzyme